MVLQSLVRDLETGYADFEIVIAYVVWDAVSAPMAGPIANTFAAAPAFRCHNWLSILLAAAFDYGQLPNHVPS